MKEKRWEMTKWVHGYIEENCKKWEMERFKRIEERNKKLDDWERNSRMERIKILKEKFRKRKMMKILLGVLINQRNAHVKTVGQHLKEKLSSENMRGLSTISLFAKAVVLSYPIYFPTRHTRWMCIVLKLPNCQKIHCQPPHSCWSQQLVSFAMNIIRLRSS